MDYQCSIFNPGMTSTTYRQALGKASEKAFDYHSSSPVRLDELNARQMVRILHERTILTIPLLPRLNEICESIFKNANKPVRAVLKAQSFRSWIDVRDWTLEVFQGEGNWAHRGYRGDDAKDLFGTMFGNLLQRLPKNVRSSLDEVPCAGLFTHDVSAYLLSSPKRDVAIVVPWNLYFLIYEGCRYLFKYLNHFVQYTGGKDKRKDREIEHICEDSVRSICNRLAHSCDAGPQLFRMPGLWSLDRAYGTLLTQANHDVPVIVQSAIYFILLHEMGHVVRGHTNTRYHLPVLTGSDMFELCSVNTIQENEADAWAIANFLKHGLGAIPGPTYLKLLGPPFVFALYWFREAVFEQWKRHLEQSLTEQGITGMTKSRQNINRESVGLWNLPGTPSSLVELPVHSPTASRLNAIISEIREYARAQSEADPWILVVDVLLQSLPDLITSFREDVTVGADDETLKKAADDAAKRVITGRVF